LNAGSIADIVISFTPVAVIVLIVLSISCWLLVLLFVTDQQAESQP
jgi:energy-converting hydrogenase Eha subunit H